MRKVKQPNETYKYSPDGDSVHECHSCSQRKDRKFCTCICCYGFQFSSRNRSKDSDEH